MTKFMRSCDSPSCPQLLLRLTQAGPHSFFQGCRATCTDKRQRSVILSYLERCTASRVKPHGERPMTHYADIRRASEIIPKASSTCFRVHRVESPLAPLNPSITLSLPFPRCFLVQTCLVPVGLLNDQRIATTKKSPGRHANTATCRGAGHSDTFSACLVPVTVLLSLD